MKLNDFTSESITSGPVPMDELLKDSLYYPACRTDGRLLKLCNTQWRSLGINSFVYCDFDVSEDEFLLDIRTVAGYHVLGHRRLCRDEYIPEGWHLEMVPQESSPDTDGQPRYWDSFLGQPGPAHFAHWVVFERNADRDVTHGPERFSLLFICGEGLATFQQLYCSRGLAPKMVCFIQCWGFAGNWTNFTGVGAPFHRTLLRYRECIPQWVCLGDSSHIDGAQKVRDLEYTGVRCLGYHSLGSLTRRFGAPVVVSGRRDKAVLVFQDGERRFAAVSVCHQLAPVLYDLTRSWLDLETFADYITLREGNAYPARDELLETWAGIRGIGRGPEGNCPVLDEKLEWRPDGSYRYSDMARTIISRVGQLHRDEGVQVITPLIRSCLAWSLDTLLSPGCRGGVTDEILEECSSLMRLPDGRRFVMMTRGL